MKSVGLCSESNWIAMKLNNRKFAAIKIDARHPDARHVHRNSVSTRLQNLSLQYHKRRGSIRRWKTEIARSWTILFWVEFGHPPNRILIYYFWWIDFWFFFFVCREWKVKFDLVDDNIEDTLEYSFKNTYFYTPAKNGPGLTGDEIVTIMNPLVLGMALGINVGRPELLPFIGNALDGLFGNLSDPFWTGRVMDLLFDGIPLNCTSDAFEVAAACAEFSTGQYKTIQPLNATFYKFSLFGGVIVANNCWKVNFKLN